MYKIYISNFQQRERAKNWVSPKSVLYGNGVTENCKYKDNDDDLKSTGATYISTHVVIVLYKQKCIRQNLKYVSWRSFVWSCGEIYNSAIGKGLQLRHSTATIPVHIVQYKFAVKISYKIFPYSKARRALIPEK